MDATNPTLDQVATDCACFNLRRAARAVTQLYDHALAPTGLRATQMTLLVALTRAESIPFTNLAAALGMDRTTVTRNVAPLERDGLVTLGPGQDRRVRLVAVTPKGRQVLERALPLWAAAQQRIVQGLGTDHWAGLRRDLQRTAALAAADSVPLPDAQSRS